MAKANAGIISIHPRNGRGQAIRQLIDIHQVKERPNKASLRDASGNGLHPR